MRVLRAPIPSSPSRNVPQEILPVLQALRTELKLPYPPSVNQLYATNWKTKRRFKTKRYEDWIAEAGWMLRSQRPRHHDGKVAVTYLIKRPDNRPRDIENLTKALGDLLVAHQVIKDDSLIHGLHCVWVESGQGVTVMIDDL